MYDVQWVFKMTIMDRQRNNSRAATADWPYENLILNHETAQQLLQRINVEMWMLCPSSKKAYPFDLHTDALGPGPMSSQNTEPSYTLSPVWSVYVPESYERHEPVGYSLKQRQQQYRPLGSVHKGIEKRKHFLISLTDGPELLRLVGNVLLSLSH